MPSTDEFESRYLVASGGEHFERRTLHIIRGGFLYSSMSAFGT